MSRRVTSFLRRQEPDVVPAFALQAGFAAYLVNVERRKMVVIVNAAASVDKISFFHKISCLRSDELAGQTLYRNGTLTGKKSALFEKQGFCTSHPVDIQRVFHR